MSPAEAKKRGANASDNNGADSEACASTHQRSHGHERLRGALVVAGVALLTVKVGIPLLKAVGGLIFRRGKGKAAERAAPTVVSGPSEDVWQVLPSTAPSVPADMKEVFSTELACSVQDFYRRFVAGSSDFSRRLHIQLEKREDYSLGPWKTVPTDGAPLPSGSPCNPDDASVLSVSGRTPYDYVLGLPADGGAARGYARSVVFVQPKKPPQNVDAECVQRQQFAVFQGDVLLMSVVQNMLNIPYKDCFTVNTVWLIQPQGSGCSVKIFVKVNFLKSVLVGGIIRMTTMNSNTAFWKKWLEAVRAELASGAPPPAALPNGGAAPAARGKGNAMFRSMYNGNGAVQGDQGAQGEAGAEVATPVRRQLRFALVVLLILVGVVNQVVLKKALSESVPNLLRR